ncbi:helix-turn-helix transcriptional regulator [Sphingomonas sp. RHCKR7]|uniref:winged helix-turn-helix transcriptional regulator n=1 Tax=Sphingomonas folli TaxID=2862497 RepID=UPI001C6637AA|nr:helix-turn-helix domain-containing protein [Sphingomonas folli]MBW6528641.1 helix-turn-helix transcriptional regulator [Sphingomonas folli]
MHLPADKAECRRRFSSDCPSRDLFDQIADKWTMMVLTVLDDGPLRFNAIRRGLEGVTQKALTQCLRRLERNGLVERRVLATSPVAVEYAITPLGRSLQPPFRALYRWTREAMPGVEAARAAFDARAGLGHQRRTPATPSPSGEGE